MRILLNNGHPIASLDMLALEVEAAAGALASLEMLVRPIEPNMCECDIAPDEEQITEHFRCIHAALRRIAVDLNIYHEKACQEEKRQADKIRHLPVEDPEHENYITDEEIIEEIERTWGKDWSLRSVDPDDRWVKAYTRRLALRYLEESAGNHRK